MWTVRVILILVVVGALGTVFKSLKRRPVWTGNLKKNRDHPDHCVVKIS